MKTSLRSKAGEINTFWNSSSAKVAQSKSKGARCVWKYTDSLGNIYYSLGVLKIAEVFGFNSKSFANWASSGGVINYKQFKDMKIVRLKGNFAKTILNISEIYTESQIQNLKLGELLEA